MPGSAAPDPTLEPRLRQEFRQRFGGAGERVFRAPGRVNLIGAHVDYHGGPVLPVAVDRSVWIAARPSADGVFRCASLDLPQSFSWPLTALPAANAAGWAAYPLGVWRTLREDGWEPGAFELLVAGTVPLGAGLSSSAALLVASALALTSLLGRDESPAQRARRAHRAETGFVGVPCGIMDQHASALAREGHALWLDCRRAEWRHVLLPGNEVQLAVVDSGAAHALRDGGYARRVEESGAAWAVLRQRWPERECLAQVTEEELEACRGELEDVPYRRARHVVREVGRVRAAVAALEAGDWSTVGALVSASHASSRDDYETSTERLDCLQEAAVAQPGVLGARVTGAGFGGGLLVLLRRERAEESLAAVREAFARRFGQEPPCWSLDTGAAPCECGGEDGGDGGECA